MEVTLPNNWTPRPDQMRLWAYLEKGGKRAVEVAHRRWGKDDVALHYTACAAMERVGNYWHMLPQYNQARKAIWEAVNQRTGKRRIDEAFPEAIRADMRNTDMFIKLKNGSTWQLVGSDNFNSLVGSPPVGLVNSEYALADPRAWAYLRPILAENGGWSVFIFTPRGMNHGYTLFKMAEADPAWHAELLTVKQTPVFNQDTIEMERRELIAQFGDTFGQTLFEQEHFCSFDIAIIGAYYSKQLKQAREDGRITNVPWLAGHEVYTFWDLGIDDSTSIWFMQAVNAERRFIDYYENAGEPLAHYAKVLKEKPYVYGDHYLPHDVEVRELGTGISRRETLENLGIKPIITVERSRDSQAVLMGIDAGRNALSQCWFDKEKTQRGLSALEAYHAKYDEERRKLANTPEHDWTSHAADAFRTFAVGFQDKAPPLTLKTPRYGAGQHGWML
jgi:hypothetical protein